MSTDQTEPSPTPAPEIGVECVAQVNFASAQNSVAILRGLTIHNPTQEPLENLSLDLSAEPGFVTPRSWTIDWI